jgi:hypothetical protein
MLGRYSAKYSRVPTADDMEGGKVGFAFDYSSAFTFNTDTNSAYKSAFTYSDIGLPSRAEDVKIEGMSK